MGLSKEIAVVETYGSVITVWNSLLLHLSVKDNSEPGWKPISSIKPTPASENVLFYEWSYLLTYLVTYLLGLIRRLQGIKSDSTPTRILSRDMRDDECSQLNCHNAWFGLSLATPGDIDQDGYEGDDDDDDNDSRLGV